MVKLCCVGVLLDYRKSWPKQVNQQWSELHQCINKVGECTDNTYGDTPVVDQLRQERSINTPKSINQSINQSVKHSIYQDTCHIHQVKFNFSHKLCHPLTLHIDRRDSHVNNMVITC